MNEKNDRARAGAATDQSPPPPGAEYVERDACRDPMIDSMVAFMASEGTDGMASALIVALEEHSDANECVSEWDGDSAEHQSAMSIYLIRGPAVNEHASLLAENARLREALESTEHGLTNLGVALVGGLPTMDAHAVLGIVRDGLRAALATAQGGEACALLSRLAAQEAEIARLRMLVTTGYNLVAESLASPQYDYPFRARAHVNAAASALAGEGGK